MIIDGMEIIGINNKFPNNLELFKEELIWLRLNKSNKNPNIDKIVSVCVNSNIVSYKLLEPSKDSFDDGNRDKTISVEVDFYIRIKYTTNRVQQYIYTIDHEMTKIIYMPMTNFICDESIDKLVRQKKISISSYIADIYAREEDANSMYLRMLFYLAVEIKNN